MKRGRKEGGEEGRGGSREEGGVRKRGEEQRAER
jgi:hypothetical protein